MTATTKKQQIVDYFIDEAEHTCNCTAPRIAFIKTYRELHDYDKAIEKILGLQSIEDDFANYSDILGESITRIIIEGLSTRLDKPREVLERDIHYYLLEMKDEIIWFVLSSRKALRFNFVIRLEDLKSNDVLDQMFHNFIDEIVTSYKEADKV